MTACRYLRYQDIKFDRAINVVTLWGESVANFKEIDYDLTLNNKIT